MNGNEKVPPQVEYLLGSAELCSRPIRPFSEGSVEFLGEISSALLHDREARAFPDLVSYAFWCRKANLLRKRDAVQDLDRRLGRGLVFHIAPSNVPVNFVFTYSFGLLAGNANLVRLPSRPFPQVAVLVRVFREVLERYPEISARTAWIRYPAGQEATAFFSRQADARMLWGGDRTVQTVRQLDRKPRCLDICFTDRYSIGLLDGRSILEASDQEVRKLAGDFYHDTWMVDQNACSSPHLLLWFRPSREAKERFWSAAVDAAGEYALQPVVAVDKYLQMCMDAMTGRDVREISHTGNLLYRVALRCLPQDCTELRGTGGYFYEYDLAGEELETALDPLVSIVTEKYQTVTCFGVEPQRIQRWVLDHGLRGIDRIVPFGKALEIDLAWDGYDLVGMLSRLVAAGK